jgi:hypothetical protein
MSKGFKFKNLNAFATDKAAVEDGRWFPIGNGAEFKIRSARSKQVQDARERIYGPYDRTLRGQAKLPKELSDRLSRQLAAEGMLADWKGVFGADDKEIPYTVEAALEAFTQYEDLLEIVATTSLESDLFRVRLDEADAGN